MAPAHQRQQVDPAVPILNFVGVELIGLGDLSVEGRLAVVAQQGLDVPVEDGRVQAGAAGRAHVLAQQSVVQCGRQLFEDSGARADEPEERGTLRRQRDRVGQSEPGLSYGGGQGRGLSGLRLPAGQSGTGPAIS